MRGLRWLGGALMLILVWTALVFFGALDGSGKRGPPKVTELDGFMWLTMQELDPTVGGTTTVA